MEQPDKLPAKRAAAYVRERRWAILPESLELIHSIAMRDHEAEIEALLAKRGTPLQGSARAQVRDGVAIIGIEGPIFRYANIFTQISGAESFEVLAKDLNAALENPAVHSIVLNINSPGGQVDGTSEFSGMVRRARKRKRVYSYISHQGASAAYWIASAAEKIVMEKGAMVGSIGTVAMIRSDKEEGEYQIVSSQSPKKRPDVETDEGRQQIQETVDALAQVFIEAVAENRDVSVEKVLSDFGQGGLLMASAAIKVGMADSIGTLESLLAELADSSTSREVSKMSDKQIAFSALTVALLMAERPDLVAEVEKTGHGKGLAEGANTERERIKAVEAQLLPGHEALIQTLKFDGKTTGEQAAVQILAAEKTARGDQLKKVVTDAPKAAPGSGEPPAPKAAAKTVDFDPHAPKAEIAAKLKPAWDADAEMRAEYDNDFDAYVSYEIQNKRGLVKRFGEKAA